MHQTLRLTCTTVYGIPDVINLPQIVIYYNQLLTETLLVSQGSKLICDIIHIQGRESQLSLL